MQDVLLRKRFAPGHFAPMCLISAFSKGDAQLNKIILQVLIRTKARYIDFSGNSPSSGNLLSILNSTIGIVRGFLGNKSVKNNREMFDL